MTDLTNYYRNLCEQLQQQIELVEKKIAEKKKAKKKLPPKGKKQGKEEQADEDYDGDGKVESKKAEYFGSKDKAIKKAMAKKKAQQMNEGRNVQSGQFLYGGFPRILNEVSSDMYEETEDGVVDQFNDGDDAPGEPKVATMSDKEEYEKLSKAAHEMRYGMVTRKIPRDDAALTAALEAVKKHPYHKTAVEHSIQTERAMRAGGMGVD